MTQSAAEADEGAGVSVGQAAYRHALSQCGDKPTPGLHMSLGLVGSERVRRHPHRRDRSAPQCGVSRGPRAYRVRVPIGGRY